MNQVRSGTVSSFDAAIGLGSVAGADGRSYPFHCTRIADGSRTIDVGTAVTFVLLAGRNGSWEADAVAPVPASRGEFSP